MTARVGDCARCDSAIERGDLRCAVCALPVAGGSDDAPQPTLQILRCTGCGAALAYDPAVEGARCAFCDSVLRAEELVDPVEQTGCWLPFTVTPTAARAAVAAWQRGLGWFRPGDLVARSRVTALQPLWWVAWVFDVRARVSWAADSDADAGRSAWAPHAGTADVRLDDVFVSASRGLTEAEARALAPSYDLRTRADAPAGLDAEALRTAVLEQFDVQRSLARGRVRDELVRGVEQEIGAEHVPGSQLRNLHVEPLIEDLETLRVAAPAYVLAYRYRDALYRVVVSGQDAGCVTGKAPVSAARVAAAIVLGLLVVLAAVLAVVAAASG